MDQRIILLYDVSIEDSLKRVATQAGFEHCEMSELQRALEKISVADARWQCLSAGEDTPAKLAALLNGMRDIPVSMRPYVIVVTDQPSAISALPEGVDETIALPISAEELAPKLRPAKRFIQLQTEFRKQALRDPLTSVLNRRAALDLLDRELLRARRLTYPVSVAMVDIDHYKRVNDELGHIAGDAVMVALAARLESQLRPYDAVGRYGGDEFLIILTNCGAAQAQVIFERIRMAVSSAPFSAAGSKIDLTISTGLAAPEPGETHTASSLIERADLALYEAKRAGRNRVVTHS